MPEVSVSVVLQVEVEPGMDPVALEHRIDAEGKRAARALYEKTLSELDQGAVEDTGGARQRLEPRWVATIFGRVRVHRWRIKGRQGSFHPLDRMLNLGRSEPSAALRETLCELATRVPYRQVADVTERITGEEISHLLAWRTVQQEGGRLIDEEGRQVDLIFGDHPGDPPETPAAPDVVIVEADGTYLKAQGKDRREDQTSFEVKTGVFYTGKARAGGRRHKRWRLTGKGAHASTGDADEFGKALATKGFHQVGIHQAKHVVCLHDGLDEFGQTFHDWFPLAIHQADRYHVNMRIWRLVEGDLDRFRELKPSVLSDPFGFAARLRNGEFGIDEDKAEEIASYLELVAPNLNGIDKLPRRYRRGKMHVISTSVVEKHQDLLVGRRMKKRGMRWSKRGANNLLALQSRKFCNRWPTEWGVVPE